MLKGNFTCMPTHQHQSQSKTKKDNLHHGTESKKCLTVRETDRTISLDSTTCQRLYTVLSHMQLF